MLKPLPPQRKNEKHSQDRGSGQPHPKDVMEIEVKEANQWGSGYPFTLTRWLTDEISQCVSDSKVFEQEYGKGWKLTIQLLANTRLKKSRVYKPNVRWKKEVCYIVLIPFIGARWAKPAAYVQPVRQWLEGIATILRKYRLDDSRFEKRIPALLKQFRSDQSRIVPDWVEVPIPIPGKLPKWQIPKGLAKRIATADGTWEEERYDPLLLTVSTGTTYQKREIPLMWQVEFDPFDERLEAAGERVEARGIEPDAYGWSDIIQKQFKKRFPKLAGELRDDSESSTCVLWVESETACKALVEVIWSLLFKK